MGVYRATCKKCQHVVRERENSSDFLDPFFLPDRCPSCHDYKSSSRWGDSGWENVYGVYEASPNFKWYNPLTWGRVFREIE